MAEQDFIVKTPVLKKSEDYAFLRAEGLRHIEKLAHRLWTDYNVHDPGITLLELLCYAITDLGYRTGYDIQDLLTESHDGVAVNRGQFHTALEILTCNPVSFDDLRKLLIDIRGVRNAWVEPHCSVKYCLDTLEQRLVDCGPPQAHVETNPSMGGLFDVYLELDDVVQLEPRSLRVGLPDNATGSGDFVQSQGRGIRFHAAWPLTLQAVSVYPETAGEVTVRLLRGDADEPLASVTVSVDRPGEKNRIPLGFAVPPGEGYRLDSKGTTVRLYRTADPVFPRAIESVIYLVSGVHGTEIQQPYYFFYDWEVSYTAPPVAIFDPPPLRTTVGPAQASEADAYVDVLDTGVGFEVIRDLVLESVTVHPEGAGDLAVRLLDTGGAELQRVQTRVDAAGEGVTIALGFELTGGVSYRIDAPGTTARLRAVAGGAYPHGAEGVIRLVAGHPATDAPLFFYRWAVSHPAQPLPSTNTREDVHLAARERLHTHRNLCEDFVNVCDLQTEAVAVCADIELSPSADVEEVLAEMFYRLGLHVSPAIAFYTIEELLDRGKATERIFEGPALDHGFIDDDEFQAIQRRCEIRSSDVVRILMDVSGVVAVKRISLLSFIDGALRIQADWVLELATGRFRAPEFTPERSKIVFYKNDLPYYASRSRVLELLREKKAADLESKLKGHERDLPVPVGTFRNPAQYHPLQNELPVNYRVGQVRVPASEGPLRKAQSRQLKAYLMFFEQLLANYLAQLAHVGTLFSWEDRGGATYFTQPVQGIAELEDIYDQGLIGREHGSLEMALAAIVEDGQTATERRSRFLEHLVVRFAESFNEYALLMHSRLGEASLSRVIEDKRAFLADYPRLSRERGTAHDYRYPGRADNLSGYQRRVYRLLGIRGVSQRDLAGHRFRIESVDVELDGVDVTRWRFVLEGEGGGRLFESILCESRSAIEGLLDFALCIGGDSQNYRPSEDAGAHELLRRCADEAEDEPIGRTTSADAAELAQVQAYFGRVGGAEGFHVVEHVLLRKRTADDPFLPVQLEEPGEGECECVEVREPYSFRVSVVLPSWPERFQDLRFRRFVEDLLRFEAPAHVYPRICWVSHAQMRALEVCHGRWAARLTMLAGGLGGCRGAGADPEDAHLSGELPLPATTTQAHEDYAQALGELIHTLHRLVTVYPLARLHDCTETEGDTPQITLNNTSLGTF